MRSGTAQRFVASGVVAANRSVVNNVTVGLAVAGQTAKLHNCTTTGAANNGNCLFTIPMDTPQSWPLEEVVFDTGVTVILSAAGDVTVSTA